MKLKFGKRLLCLLLASCLAFGAFSAEAAAAGVSGAGGSGAMLESREQLGGGTFLLSAARTYGAPLETGEDFYSQLSPRQQACYNTLKDITIDQVLSADTVMNKEKPFRRIRKRISGISDMSLEGSFSGGSFRPAESSKDAVSNIYTDLNAAILALRYDRPDILWIGYLFYGYWVVQTGSSTKITDVVFDFSLEYEGREKTMYETMMERAQAIADEAGAAPDTYSRVKAVHDLLAQSNIYGNPDDLTAHSAYSALVPGDAYEPVCDGYSKAFKIVCGLMDIPCVTPSSKAHMWNNVKMDDGEWYNLDLTWDDSDNEALSHDYFLVGSQTAFDGTAFSLQRDHIEENPYAANLAGDSSGMLKPLTFLFPEKNKEKYEYQGKDYDPLTFPDVKRSAWYYGFVETAAQMGLVSGDANGLFRPVKEMTRAEFAAVMANCLGADLPARAPSAFTDVPADAWYAPVVAWAKEAKIMEGDPGGTFRPTSPISRQEMCVVICKVLKPQPQPVDRLFADDGKIDSWAREAVYQCYAIGLLEGDTHGNFMPRNNTQRCQAAVVFSRFAQMNPENPDQDSTPDQEPDQNQNQTTDQDLSA